MRRLTILLAALAALMLVPAASAFANGTLFVNVVGSGSGEISSAGGTFGLYEGTPAIECSYESPGPTTGTCENELEAFEEEFEATALHAVLSPGSELIRYEVEEGNDAFKTCGENNPTYGCVVGFPYGTNGEAFVTAIICLEGEVFNEETLECEGAVASEQPLTLKINEGEGTVVSDPAGITCTGASGTECTEEFPEGEEVTLTASPAAGYRFQQWQNCPSGNFGNRQCTVTMSEAKEVSVKFKRVYALTIVKAGSGLGSIYNNKNGLTCTLRCQTVTIPFPEGVSFTLTGEAPNKEFYFKEFTGGTGSASACSGTECTMTLSEASTVEAVFEDRPTETLSIDKEGGGTAKIWGLLWCSENCTSTSGDFFSGEPSAKEVVVNWELAPGTSSIEWTSGAGTCTGTKTAVSGSCKVTMNEAHALVAKLE